MTRGTTEQRDIRQPNGAETARGNLYSISKELLRSFLSYGWQVVRRFPAPVAFVILFAVQRFDSLAASQWLSHTLAQHLSIILACSFLWSLTVAIWAEAGNRTGWEAFIVSFSGLVAIVLLLGGQNILHSSPGLLLLLFLLLLSLAAHSGQSRQNDAFWLYNRRLWFAAGYAVLAAMVLVAMVFLLAGSSEYLLSRQLPRGFYSSTMFVGLGAVAPLSWLTMISKRDGRRETSLIEGEAADNMGHLLLQYLIVPLLLLYSLLLYRYAWAVAQGDAMPAGRLGPAILGYALLGMASYIMSYPWRRRGALLVRLFWKSWFVIALVPILLLGAAIYVRIDAYGLTEARYLLAMVVVWLLVLSFAFVVLRIEDLRLIPASLAALLVVGAFGPLGAMGLSLRSQQAQLAGLLARNQLLQNGRIAPGAGKAVALREGDEARIRSVLYFLEERGELRRLAPWFKGRKNNPFALTKGQLRSAVTLTTGQSIPKPDQQSVALFAAVAAALSVSGKPLVSRHSRSVVFYARAPLLMPLQGALRLAGPVNLSLSPGKARETITIAAGTGRDLVIALNERRLVIKDRRGRSAVFDLVKTAHAIEWFENPAALEPALTKPRQIAPMPGASLNLRLLVTSLQGQRSQDGSYGFRQISFWLLVHRKNHSPNKT